MLLNHAQYKELIKILNSIAQEIEDLINDTKDKWNQKDPKEKDSFQRGMHLGKLGAYTTCLQMFRNRADSFYKLEMEAADLRVLDSLKKIERQCDALNLIASKISQQPESQQVSDQVLLLRNVLKEIELVLRQTGIKTE